MTALCITTYVPSVMPLIMASDLSILHPCECSCVTLWRGIVERSSEISQSVSSVAQSCPTLCDPMDHSMPGLPVHQLPESTQTPIHRVDDAIQPSHPLSSPSSPAFNLSQPPGSFPMCWFFASDGQSIGVSASTSVLPMNAWD